MALLEVANLSVRFGAREVVSGVGFTLEKGETLALVGESGSGKSVTALSILQLLPPGAAGNGPGSSIRIDGEEMVGAPLPRLRQIRGERVGLIFQEPMTSLNPLHSVERQIGETLRLHGGLGGRAARARIVELLREVGFPDAVDRLKAFPHQLSGGQRQRVMIAMALANNPDLLVADEPTTALDVTIQAQILALLKDLQQRLGLALLLITHNLAVVRRMADRVAIMTAGEIVETGPTEAVFAAPAHAYTRHLLAAEPKPRVARTRLDPPILLDAQRMTVRFPLARRGFGQRRTLTAVDDVGLTLRAGETLGIVGESGSGKSTLALALLRLTRAEGRIVYAGRDLTGMAARPLRALRREMQIVFQDPFSSLNPRLTAAQIVEEGLRVHERLSSVERQARVEAALAEVGLDPAGRDRYPHEFSGGQRQRIAIARALVMRPKLIVLDEPTSALDMSIGAQIVDLLRDLQDRHGLSYVFISHDLTVVRAMADRVMVMKAGKVIEEGPMERLFAAPQQPYTAALLRAALDILPAPSLVEP